MRYRIKRERRVPAWCIAVYTFTVLVVIAHVFFYLSKDFADWFNMTVGALFRGLFAKVTGVLPFSLAETIILLLPIGSVALCIWAVKSIIKNPGAKSTRIVCSLLSMLCLLYSAFVINFASAYRGHSIDEKLGLEREAVSAEQLKITAKYFRDKATEEAEKIEHYHTGGARMPYSLDEMVDRLNSSFKTVSEKYDFVQSLDAPVKYIALSEPMTYTYISGVYTFFTGEANININFPDYGLPFTAAHEMAHQRGVAPEDEANFVAFLVCEASDDAFIRYSGYMSMYEYLLDALYSADKSMFVEVRKATDRALINEFIVYNEFLSKYSDDTVAAVSDAVNDTYLKIQGQSEGTKSYGMVVDLAVAWVEKHAYNDSSD